uniref:Uncharacterized protein n=1 Tax=Sus scrofa TaxID=9823 RepID=A0A8W4FIP2_PIG
MLKMAMKIKARMSGSGRKTAAAAAEVAAEAAAVAAALAEPHAPQKKGDAEKPPKKPARDAPPEKEKFLTEKEQRKIEKKLLEQKRKEEKKKEKERKKLEKMQKTKKKKKKVPEAPEEARGPGVAAAAAAAAAEGAAEGADGGGVDAGTVGMSRIWVEWETDSDSSDEDDDDDEATRFRGTSWGSGLLKIGGLSSHLPLLAFLVFSVRSPAWVLDFLLQKRPEQGRGCGFFFGATCCFRMFLGCAFFSFLGGRAKRRGRGRTGASGAFGSGHGARRRGLDERFV